MGVADSGEKRPRIVVIGGGIAGLAAAHRIIELAREAPAERAPSVVLLEASDRLGGVIQTVTMEDGLIELGPDSFITQKPWALALCRRLGLDQHIVEMNDKFRRSLIVHRGRLCAVPDGFMMLAPSRWWPFVCSPLFSPLGKLRMALDLVLPRKAAAGDESLTEFVVRRLGREALERVAQPMIGGVYTADPDRLSLRAAMPRFLELEEKYGSVIRGMMAEGKARQAGAAAGGAAASHSGARYGMFVSLDRGMQLLVDRISERIGPANLEISSSVKSVARDAASGGWSVTLADGPVIEADALILAGPSVVAANLLAGVDGELAGELASIEYASSVVINFVFRRCDISHPLDGFGFVVPAIERRSIIACTFSSVKFPGRAPADKVILRAFLGGALAPEIAYVSDDTMLNAALADLGELLGISADPLLSVVARFPSAMPQYYVGHLDRINRIELRAGAQAGLALAGNAYQGVGIPDCIHSGELAAESVIAYLAARSAST